MRTPMDDQEAIERCRKGENEAFRYIVERYQRLAVNHATAILGNREDALDAAQEAFIDAFRALGNFDKARQFYPWFYVLLRNRCYKLMARRRETEGFPCTRKGMNTTLPSRSYRQTAKRRARPEPALQRDR